MALDVARVREVCQRQATPSVVLSRDETREAKRLAEALKTVLWGKAHDIVAGCHTGPILYSYQPDGTLFVCQHIVARKVNQTLMLRRNWTHRVEFLLQRGVVLSRSVAGDARVAQLVMDPMNMSSGTKTGHLMQASIDFLDPKR